MAEQAVVVAAGVVALWAVTAVHGVGHYVGARFIAGMDGSMVRLVSPILPLYVAIQDDSGWAGPTEFDRYREAYESFDPAFTDFERVLAGGDIIQTAVVVPGAFVLSSQGFPDFGAGLLVISLTVTALFVLADAGLSLRNGTASGVYSGLWRIDAKIPIFLLLGFAGTHLAVLSLLL
jgi:hypothetical protein